jgi:hypothetical protein
LLLQEFAPQCELGALPGVAGGDGPDAVPQAILPFREPKAFCFQPLPLPADACYDIQVIRNIDTRL